jgi:anti-sigma regulatory factor (Ser/Thr protein kinase)
MSPSFVAVTRLAQDALYSGRIFHGDGPTEIIGSKPGAHGYDADGGLPVNSQPAGEPAYNGSRVTFSVRSAPDLSRARAAVVEAAARGGIDEDRAGRLAVAVSEIATNAIVHADGGAHVEIIMGADRIVVEISDSGPGLPPDRPTELPAPGHDHGRGLWLVQQLCDLVEVLAGPAGTRIALSVLR